MKKLRAVIVDDELDSVRLLGLQLQEHCPWVEVAGSFTSAVQAVEGIDSLQPDLLFLDIEMPGLNGFELLEKVLFRDFSLIFVTAYSQFAVKAFRYNALDYLVKPAEAADLVKVVQKAARLDRADAEQLKMLERQMKGKPVTKIAIPSQTGVSFIDLEDIVYVEANNNYSVLVLRDKRKVTVSRTLKDVQEVLEEQNFLRVHRQYIINLNHVVHFNRTEGVLTMANKEFIPVARLQKEKLVARYGWL